MQGRTQLTYENLWVQYDSAWTYKNLQLIPIRYKGGSAGPGTGFPTNLISLPEGLASGKITVKEIGVPPGADIGVVLIKNNSKKNLLINSGEMFSGGKQDRIIGETAIIPPDGKDHYTTVFCIEKGRWAEKAKAFTHSGSADMGLRKRVDVDRKQNDVWKEIEQRFKTLNKKNETEPYLDLYRNVIKIDTNYMNYFMNRMRASDSLYAGFLAVTGNRIIGCEIFITEEFTLSSYKSMLGSYIHSLTVEDSIPVVPFVEKKKFMNSLLVNEEQQKQFLLTHGRAYKYEEKVIHIIAYGD